MSRVKMINGLFGNVMLVAEDRVEEYKKAGHKLASAPNKPDIKPEKPEKEEKGLVKELKEEEKKKSKRK